LCFYAAVLKAPKDFCPAAMHAVISAVMMPKLRLPCSVNTVLQVSHCIFFPFVRIRD